MVLPFDIIHDPVAETDCRRKSLAGASFKISSVNGAPLLICWSKAWALALENALEDVPVAICEREQLLCVLVTVMTWALQATATRSSASIVIRIM